MLDSAEYIIRDHINLLPKDRSKCMFIADLIIIECMLVWFGSATVLFCIWTPQYSTWDYDKLTRIMYLYDADACGYKINTSKLIANLHISNETFGLQVLPIKWLPVIITVSSRLSVKTRKYIEFSLYIHIMWCILAVAFRWTVQSNSNVRALKIALAIFFYSCVFVVCFDLSMAVIYITHIKQSLTKGMILRYSGWSTEMKLDSYDDFAGWLPIVACVCWLRGFVIFLMNVCICTLINGFSRKVKRTEFIKKYPNERYLPFPESQQIQETDKKVLVFRVGETEPHAKRRFNKKSLSSTNNFVV